jgi:hypothetical protein
MGNSPRKGKAPKSPNTIYPMKLRIILHSDIITQILKTRKAKRGEERRQATQAGHSTDELPSRESPIQEKTPWRYTAHGTVVTGEYHRFRLSSKYPLPPRTSVETVETGGRAIRNFPRRGIPNDARPSLTSRSALLWTREVPRELSLSSSGVSTDPNPIVSV